MLRLRGDDARDRSAAGGAVHDLRVRRAERLAGLVGAHRDPRPAHVTSEQVESRHELRPRAVGEGRLVRLHAPRTAAGEHQAEERRHGAAPAA